MSLMALLKVRSTIASFFEMIFFCAVSALYFAAVIGLYMLYASATKTVALEKLTYGDWPGQLPTWLWIVMGIGYLALITFYWVPGDDETNKVELRAFAVFLVVAAIAGVVYLTLQYGLVFGLLKNLKEVFWPG